MINLDALTLKLLKNEIRNFFTGAKIQKIQQPNRSELIFHIRNSGETRKFYINFNPNFYHLCFMSKENEIRRNITIPKAAPMFCMLLRKYILNAKISKIEVPEFERIFEIYFEYFDELNQKSQLCLAIELMGKYSNAILYNYDTNVIIGCAHNVSPEKSRERELSGLLPYVYPVKQKKKNLLKTDCNSFISGIDSDNPAKSIAEKYHYLTSSFVQDIIQSEPDFSYENLFKKLTEILSKKNYSPCIAEDYSKYYVIEMKNTVNCSSINEMIDNYFSYHQLNNIISDLRQKIIKYSNTQSEKLNSLKIKQETQINKSDVKSEYKMKADVITANLFRLKSGIKNIKLTDFNNKEITIDLDENLTPSQNAEKYYTMYKKAKTSGEHAAIMLEETKSKILYFEEMKYFAINTKDINELKSLYNELTGITEQKDDKAQFIEPVIFEGFKIYTGKNKKQNDYILSKLSSPEDLWFHPLNAAGAHVIVKINNSKKTVPQNVILKAAQITKEFSSQKNNSKTSVIYTKRKYVKKAKNKQAFVTYKNETEVIV